MLKILIVDDDPRVLRSLNAVLEESNKIVTCDSIQQAKYLILMNAVEPFDVVMTHERMPGDKGHRFFNWCQQNCADTKRVMMLGMPIEQELKDLLLDIDTISFMTKPWNSDDVVKAIAN